MHEDNPNSIVEALLNRQLEKQKQQEVIIENIDEYKIALARIFETNEGKLFAKYLLRFIGLYIDAPQINPAGLIEEKGRKSVYLKLIRPFLPKEIKMEIENAE